MVQKHFGNIGPHRNAADLCDCYAWFIDADANRERRQVAVLSFKRLVSEPALFQETFLTGVRCGR